MAAAPQGRHNTCLLIRRELGKYIRRFCHLDQLVIAHAFHIGAEQKIAYLEAHLLADTAGHTVVISGEDFCGDAMGFQCPNRLRGGFLGRIKKCKVSHQNHIALVLDAVCISGRKRPFLRNGDYAHPVLIQIGYCFQNRLPNLIGKWLHLSLIFRMRTDGEHFFYGTLGNHLPFPAGILYNR